MGRNDEQFAMLMKQLVSTINLYVSVSTGSLDPEMLARIMDENATSAIPKMQKYVMREALITSALVLQKQRKSALTGTKLSCPVK